LCIFKGELLLEERNVTAHKVWLKRIPDLVLNAHPTHAAEHAAATATTLTTPAAALPAALAATTLALPATLRRRCALLRERRHGQQRLSRNNGCDDERRGSANGSGGNKAVHIDWIHRCSSWFSDFG
jgi:hypothetical protein